MQPPGGYGSLGGAPFRTPAGPQQPLRTDNKAVLSMVLGIVGTVLCCLPLVGPICGTIAIIFYAKFNAAYRAAGGNLGGKGMAIAGLVTGIVGTALGALYTIYWIVVGFIIGGATRGLSSFLR